MVQPLKLTYAPLICRYVIWVNSEGLINIIKDIPFYNLSQCAFREIVKREKKNPNF